MRKIIFFLVIAGFVIRASHAMQPSTSPRGNETSEIQRLRELLNELQNMSGEPTLEQTQFITNMLTPDILCQLIRARIEQLRRPISPFRPVSPSRRCLTPDSLRSLFPSSPA